MSCPRDNLDFKLQVTSFLNILGHMHSVFTDSMFNNLWINKNMEFTTKGLRYIYLKWV